MSVKRLFVLLFIVSLFGMSIRETLDPDLWWHLKTGDYILQNGIPHQDIFSFTVPNHVWITHEWLSEVLMWLIYSAAGLPGLMVGFALLITLTYWILYLSCAGRPYLAGFVVVLSAITSAIVWGARPQIFNLLLTALFVWIVAQYKKNPERKRLLWWLVPLTAVWANLHSGYLLGVVLLACYVGGAVLDRWFKSERAEPLAWTDIRYLGIVTFLSFLAAVLNPNGAELWIYPFFTLGSRAMQAYIQEWHSPNFHLGIFWPFVVMLTLGPLSWILDEKRPSLTDGLLFFGTGAAGLLSARHIPLFAIVAAPIICKYFWFSLENSSLGQKLSVPNPKPTQLISFANIIILLVAVVGVIGWSAQKISDNEAAITSWYPVAAVDFLEDEGLANARIYNSYNWGGYLIWRDIPVFVDGRADVYGDPFLFEYREAFDASLTWEEPLDNYNVDYVIMERGSPLNTLLELHPNWESVYLDDIAQIYSRKEASS
ncbi:MAG: hypothetical protein AAF490_05120 [Chloroflexota bacterium]